MNLALSLGVDGGAAAAKKRKVRDGDVGAAGDCGDCGRNRIMRLLQERDRVAKVKLADQYRDGDDDDGSRGGGGLRLMRLLLSSAAAAEVGDTHTSAVALREVSRHASFRGGDPVQRVAAHFADALASRLLLSPRAPAPAVASSPPRATRAEQSFLAFTMFYQASPFYQFAHFTANQAILEAFEAGGRRARSLHVVDFDVSFGFQWPSLIQSLSDAATTSPQSSGDCDVEPAAALSLRITGFGTSAEELRDTEARLARFAAGCPNLRFEFEGIVMTDNGSALHGGKNIKVDPSSTVVVNLVFPAATRRSSLAYIRSLNPSLVFLIDKDVLQDNGASLLPRFGASLRYYAAVFESLHECLPADSAERLAIERDHLGVEIGHAMASLEDRQHGADRVMAWTEAMESAGFEGARLSSRTVSQAKLLLKMKSGGCGGFRVIEGGGEDKAVYSMSLGWRDRALITATAWRTGGHAASRTISETHAIHWFST